MKKVLCATLILAFMAPVAWATIKGSPHDLASSNTAANMESLTVDRTCVFCHTPHAADTTESKAPLWNRAVAYDFNAVSLYTSSATLTATAKAVDEAAIEATDAPLCMSCHDGTLGDNLNNVPNGYAATDFEDADFANAGSMTATALIIDADGLSNDHPIGFNYNTVQGEDATGLKAIATAKTNGAAFYGASSEMMWCSSCHDVHEYGTSGTTQPFLIMTNAGSDLCFACHNK